MFKNIGDEGFYDGGRFVEVLDGAVEVIGCDILYDDPKHDYLLFDVAVDGDDIAPSGWIDLDAINEWSGSNSTIDEIMQDDTTMITFALDAIGYYGPQEFGDPGKAMTRDEVIEFMDDFSDNNDFDDDPWRRD